MLEENRPSVLDVFAAPGGLSEGFRQARYFIAAQIDNDLWGCKTLTYNFANRGTLVIQGDIRSISITGKVDVVIGGPPCQSFSMVGRPKIAHLQKNKVRKRFIDDERNRLYKEFVRIVKSVNPQFFVMENVPGIYSFDEGKIVEQILEDFEAVGYYTQHDVLNAVQFGVPQVRKRVFFIGNRIGVKNPFPHPTHADLSKGQMSLFENRIYLKDYVRLRDAISDLPVIQAGEGSDEMKYPPMTPLSDYQIMMRKGSRVVYNHIARGHSERDRKLFRMLNEGEKMSDLPENLRPYDDRIFSDKIKKQSWSRPSSAVLSHMQKDCLMYVHPDLYQARTFTPRESARVQSFRDKYRFRGPMTQQFRQIGNAVPPLLAKRIAMSIRPLLQPAETPLVSYNILTA